MNIPVYNRTLALAGVFQSVRLVQQTARGEPRNQEATTASIGSIFNTDPASILDVYGNLTKVSTGLEILVQQLGNDNHQRDMELTRYAVTLISLEHKLSQQPELLEIIRFGIESIHFESVVEEQTSHIAILAEIYKKTVSTLQPRLLIKGEPAVLGNTDSKNMVRALLLAGIRSAVLLHQSGGTRLKLLWQRGKLLECARKLLEELPRSA